MADPVIVPPTPTVVQPSQSAAEPLDITKHFDQAFPEVKTRPTPDRSPLTQQANQPPVSEPPKTTEAPKTAVEPPAKTVEDQSRDVPSFLEQALRGESPPATQVPPPAAEEEWPEELPTFKTPEESKARYKKWRESYNTTKTELKKLQEKPTLNAQQLQRMELLERQNSEMQGIMSRLGVEHSAEFQNSIMRPLHAAWNDATRIVQQAGGDPQALAKAMSLTGKAQFEALDDILSGLPESAKAETNDALRVYRRYEDARQATIRNAPAAMEGIRKRETERQYAEVNRQREEMRSMFDNTLGRMRNEVELFKRTNEPEGKWWNDQADQIEKTARELYLENSDMNKVAAACLLAPAADAYRRLWINSQKKIGELQKVIKERLGGEPVLTESGGNGSLSQEALLSRDLKRPLSELFVEEVHRQAQKGGGR